MSAIAALKGYRTQFLYSLHYILSTLSNDFIYRLEGEEDLDILDPTGRVLYAIQLKNLNNTITLSDILSENKTSFIRRFIANYPDAVPILVSYGKISDDLKNWEKQGNSVSDKEKGTLKKYKLTLEQWKLVKAKVQFNEIEEEAIAEEINKMMKDSFALIDPIPTTGYLLNWLQTIAEKQIPISKKEFLSKIEDFGLYLTERIAIEEQYGLITTPLHKVSTSDINVELLEKEFYNATVTKYQHILLELDVSRETYLEQINIGLATHNVAIIKGASGQGKTALIYKYVYRYLHNQLAFEIKVQTDPIISQKSIKAIASISKSLEIPVAFVINVQPNNTEWLKIVKETAHLKHIKFLIAVRNEDWYRATATGVEFEHIEIDLKLSKEEAEIIYSQLDERNKIGHFTDFEEAWIRNGSNAPLLEFVYSITQGDSLYNKLNQQVQQILLEDGLTNNPQIDFLRTVSLADAFGAKIDVNKLDTDTDYHFIIKKLEDEYLIRKSPDKKSIQGLHIVRSQILVNILFDNYSTQKEIHAIRSIPLVVPEDLYLYLLQLLNLGILQPAELLSKLNDLAGKHWSIYASLLKVFIWIGIKEFVESNRTIIDKCRGMYGDGWFMLLDFHFGTNFDREELLNLLMIDKEKKASVDELNARLSDKSDVFIPVENFVNRAKFPLMQPISAFEWKCFGEILFWLKHIPNTKESIQPFSEKAFEYAFETCDIESLAKLMLGMYYYSSELNNIRRKFAHYFIDKVKNEYDILYISVEDADINIHFIIDVLNSNNKRASNDFAVGVLTLLRSAFPDKIKFSSQGYGHKLSTYLIDYDETNRSISIDNLPLREWVDINACFIKLYEYSDRPISWVEYCNELSKWEQITSERINQFNTAFRQLLKERTTYEPVTPILSMIGARHSNNIKAPQSISDALGIDKSSVDDKVSSANASRQNSKENFSALLRENKMYSLLQDKYLSVFKSQSAFQTDIENFIFQSAQTLASRIKKQLNSEHIHDEHIERLSQINLFNAIENLKEYNQLYKTNFNGIDKNHPTEIDANNLFITATLWKDYLTNNPKGEHSANRINRLKNDFEYRLIKECKKVSKENPFKIVYKNNKQTNFKPILIIDSRSPILSFIGMETAYNIVHTAIANPEYTSLKYLMLQVWFSNFYFIQTIEGKSINNLWIEMRLYNLQEKSFTELINISFITQTIDSEILKNLEIESWATMFPALQEINIAAEAYSKLTLLVDHFYDLRFFDNIELEQSDHEKLQEYINKVGIEIKESFQKVLDSLAAWLNMFPINEDIYLINEEEQRYFIALMNVSDNIFPQPKGDEENYELVLNMNIMQGWIDRLKVCSENWGIFILLLYGKYINRYK